MVHHWSCPVWITTIVNEYFHGIEWLNIWPRSTAFLNHGCGSGSFNRLWLSSPETWSHCSPLSRTSSALQQDPPIAIHMRSIWHKMTNMGELIQRPVLESFFEVSTALSTSNWCWFLARAVNHKQIQAAKPCKSHQSLSEWEKRVISDSSTLCTIVHFLLASNGTAIHRLHSSNTCDGCLTWRTSSLFHSLEGMLPEHQA